jgi:hypothetical protein
MTGFFYPLFFGFEFQDSEEFGRLFHQRKTRKRLGVGFFWRWIYLLY